MKASGVDFTIWNKYVKHHLSGEEDLNINAEYAAQIHLLHILKRNGAPLKLFNEIMKWTNKTAAFLHYDFLEESLSQPRLIAKLLQKYNLQNYKPRTKSVELPFSKQKVDIIVHDIKEAIYSLLSDSQLMQSENFIFREDLFEHPNKRPKLIKDINDGINYKKAFLKWCKKSKIYCVY